VQQGPLLQLRWAWAQIAEGEDAVGRVPCPLEGCAGAGGTLRRVTPQPCVPGPSPCALRFSPGLRPSPASLPLQARGFTVGAQRPPKLVAAPALCASAASPAEGPVPESEEGLCSA